MKVKIVMKWVAERNRWDVIKENGFVMYDIPDCENVDILFGQPSKDKDGMYEIEINKIEG